MENKYFNINPSKNILILFTSIWFLGITLSILSITNLFTEHFLQKKHVTTYFAMVSSTLVIGLLYFFITKINLLN